MYSLTGIENHRKIKANTDYYLLRDNDTPTVIAEVCFLSNPSEAAMIAEETIQEKAAFQIAYGNYAVSARSFRRIHRRYYPKPN